MVGKRIKDYLESNGIKQSFVAEKVGIPASQLSEICKVLNVPFETFLEEGEE